MSISVGGINIPNAILNLEFEVARTQRIVEWLLNNNATIRGPDARTLQLIDDEAFAVLKKKYPDAGIERTTGGR